MQPLSLKGSRGHGQQHSEQEVEPVFPGGLASSFLEEKQESKTFRFYKASEHKNDAKQVMISDMSCFSHLTS